MSDRNEALNVEPPAPSVSDQQLADLRPRVARLGQASGDAQARRWGAALAAVVDDAISLRAALAEFARLDVRLPLAIATDDAHTIVDADDRLLCVVDMNRERPDDQGRQIAAVIVSVLNAGRAPMSRSEVA